MLFAWPSWGIRIIKLCQQSPKVKSQCEYMWKSNISGIKQIQVSNYKIKMVTMFEDVIWNVFNHNELENCVFEFLNL
jgi:hypothetical protein